MAQTLRHAEPVAADIEGQKHVDAPRKWNERRGRRSYQLLRSQSLQRSHRQRRPLCLSLHHLLKNCFRSSLRVMHIGYSLSLPWRRFFLNAIGNTHNVSSESSQYLCTPEDVEDARSSLREKARR